MRLSTNNNETTMGKNDYRGIQEEELKNKVAHDYFADYDSTQIIGKIDFCIAVPQEGTELFETESLLWAEAKAGVKKDIYESFVQLILTIGRARTFDHHLPPAFLGAFDAEKIAFLPYNEVIDVFYQNDFNWNVTPSDHETKEFRQLYDKVKADIERDVLLYRFGTDDTELHAFIRRNFVIGKSRLSKIRINKNNFTHIYQKWLKEVKPTIAIDWDAAKREGLIDADFYLADILSEHNVSLKEKLFVLLRSDRYVYNIQRKVTGSLSFETVEFNDQQVGHTQFWNRYNRPPRREYWDYIVERRDLLVPQDIRERHGSFFTPQQWVELSQEYLAAELGEDWQEEYYIWDCAAGTGNLLNGLTNKYNIWASTLDTQDVKVMQDLIANNRLNLLEGHVFQFDFLNDPFSKLPKPLQDIIADPQRRKKLVIYINPPYKEAPQYGSAGQKAVEQSKVNKKYASVLGQGNRELFAQFFTRIYHEIPSVVLAEFSKLKILQGPHFVDFRNFFRAKLGRFFVVPANTFDNVSGNFPIGFMVWHTDSDTAFTSAVADVYDREGNFTGKKCFYAYDYCHYMNEWAKNYRAAPSDKGIIGKFPFKGNDFQNQNMIQIVQPQMKYNEAAGQFLINGDNVHIACIYFAVRKCIPATWLNDRDQFLYPNDGWQNDLKFQTDCLAYTLFSNNIQCQYGTNHWIPFTEQEVDAKERFQSHFMTDYISGKTRPQGPVQTSFLDAGQEQHPLSFSPEAQAVMNAGRELWRYYHAQPDTVPDAAFYDIRLHFQGRNARGVMNADSTDEHYTELIGTLRQRLRELARKIEPKVYEYGFLMR